MARFLVYSLTDPRTGEIRYVGKTVRTLRHRLRCHLAPTYLRDPTYKNNWLKELIREGLAPSIEVLEECESLDALNTAECAHIARLRAEGVRLTNGTDGGDGWSLGYKRSVESIEKTARGLRGLKRSHATKMLISRVKGGRPFIDQHGTIYEVLEDAARLIGSTASCILEVLRGNSRTAKGYVFSYDLSKPASIRLGLWSPKAKPFQDQHGNIFRTLDEAAASHNLNRALISAVLNGRQKQTHGYVFTYLFSVSCQDKAIDSKYSSAESTPDASIASSNS